MCKVLKALSVVTIVGAAAFGTISVSAKPPKGGGTGCPKNIVCADVWIPVQCADGIIYSNACYADRACAPGPCVPVDGGPVE